MLGVVCALGCGEASPPDRDATPSDATPSDAARPDVPLVPPRPDAPLDVGLDAAPDVPRDAGLDTAPDAPLDARVDAPPDAAPPMGVAPTGAVALETAARDGDNPLTLNAGEERVLRVEARPTEHVQFTVRFTPSTAAVVLQVDRWDGAAPRALGRTDAGPGLRVLAAFDPDGPRTLWARVRSAVRLTDARLTVTRTPFADGARCEADCDRLLQLPLPNDPARDGYATTTGTVFRYQFGRRDLVMFLRHAGQVMARMGRAPVVPEDLSQWDGLTPGSDTGNLRHASHQRGKDVDLSLYGADGRAPWRSYCTPRTVSGGRECTPGTVTNFDAATNAQMFAAYFATLRVTMCFLDRELIARVTPAAQSLGFSPAVAAQFRDGVHLQHWPNHDNHIHVRVSEGPSTGAAFVVEGFEPP
ncbi:MAG: hypothetical protein U0325_11765 [Polyangiales bacterium]